MGPGDHRTRAVMPVLSEYLQHFADILQSLMILVYSSLLVHNATGAQKRWLLMSGAQLKLNLNIPCWQDTAYFST